MPTECPANITETCQCGHHDQLLVPNVEGTSVCNMAPSLPADEVAGASSANSFCPQVPKMFHDTDFILKLLICKAWSTGAEPGSSKRARSWNPCRISHLLEHVSVILLIKYICLGHLLWPEESFEYPGWFIENRLMQRPTLQSSIHSYAWQMNAVLFKLRSMPHGCNHQVDRVPFQAREQGTLYFVFQEVVWNLTASPHLCLSTLSLLGYSPTSEQAFLLPPLASLCSLLNTAARVTQLKCKPNQVTALCKFLHLLPVSHRMKAKVLIVPSKLDIIWPLITSLTCSLPVSACTSCFNPAPGFLVTLHGHQLTSSWGPLLSLFPLHECSPPSCQQSQFTLFKSLFKSCLLNKMSPNHPIEYHIFNLKSTLNVHWKDWCWCWSSNTLATW